MIIITLHTSKDDDDDERLAFTIDRLPTTSIQYNTDIRLTSSPAVSVLAFVTSYCHCYISYYYLLRIAMHLFI